MFASHMVWRGEIEMAEVVDITEPDFTEHRLSKTEEKLLMALHGSALGVISAEGKRETAAARKLEAKGFVTTEPAGCWYETRDRNRNIRRRYIPALLVKAS